MGHTAALMSDLSRLHELTFSSAAMAGSNNRVRLEYSRQQARSTNFYG